MSEYVSENFRKSEFECHCCGVYKMDKSLIESLQALREYVMFPLIITSGYRCKVHNFRVGGVDNSQHTLGLAVDISTKFINGYKLFDLIDAAIGLGFKGIGVSPKFLHVDTRASEGALWVY